MLLSLDAPGFKLQTLVIRAIMKPILSFLSRLKPTSFDANCLLL